MKLYKCDERGQMQNKRTTLTMQRSSKNDSEDVDVPSTLFTMYGI